MKVLFRSYLLTAFLHSYSHSVPTPDRFCRYGCSTEATPPVADPAAVHLIRQVQIRDFDPDLYLGGGSEAEFARHEAEKRWVAEEAGLRATGEPWFVEAPHYDKSGTFCSGQGEVTAGDGSRIHASWAKEHAAIWRCVLRLQPPAVRN